MMKTWNLRRRSGWGTALALAGLTSACTAPHTPPMSSSAPSRAASATAPQPAPLQPDWRLSADLSASLRNGHTRTPATPIAPAGPNPLTVGPTARFDDLQLVLPDGSRAGFDRYLAENFVEGLIVLHRGRVVYEQYFNGLGPRDTHSWASMAKSVIGVLAVELAAEGRLQLDAPLGRYVPELAGTPFGRATVQQNLDMQVALAYRPEVPPDLGLFTAAGLLPPRPGMPTSIHEFLGTPRPVDAPHGAAFFYQNGSTEAVAWALSRVSGQPIAQLVSQRLWQPMGAEAGAFYSVDRQQTAFAAGGLSSTLRDAARFGELVRNGGRAGARQVLAPDTVRRILATPPASNQALLRAAGRAREGGTGYQNFWWYPIRATGAVLANGRFGQRILVDPRHELTVAQFGAYPDTRPRGTTAQARTDAHASVLRTDDGVVALAQAIAQRLQAAPAP